MSPSSLFLKHCAGGEFVRGLLSNAWHQNQQETTRSEFAEFKRGSKNTEKMGEVRDCFQRELFLESMRKRI